MIKNYTKNFILFFILLNKIVAIDKHKNATQNSIENIYSSVDATITNIKREEFESILKLAPNVKLRTASDIILEVPIHNGDKKLFKFFESNVLPSSLKVKYPSIRSFIGIGIENPSHRSSIVIYDGGLYGLVLEENGRSFFLLMNLIM